MDKQPPIFMGLDLETSGTNIEEGAVPIQVGLAMFTGWPRERGVEMFSELIGGYHWMNVPGGSPAYYTPADYPFWDGISATIHNIPIVSLEPARSAQAVAETAVEWIDDRYTGKPYDTHIVGWNVGGFDYPFVKRYMPALNERLSYRTVDLNAVVFSMTGLPDRNGQPQSAKTLKRRAKKYATEEMAQMFDEPQWHDAGYDAISGLFCYDWLKATMRAQPLGAI